MVRESRKVEYRDILVHKGIRYLRIEGYDYLVWKSYGLHARPMAIYVELDDEKSEELEEEYQKHYGTDRNRS